MTDISYNTSMSDKALSQMLGAYIKHHRLAQNKTQNDVSKAAGISRSTLSLLERGETVTMASFIQVLRVLDLLHVLNNFSIETQISPIALAKAERAQRERASGGSLEEPPSTYWPW